MGFACIQVARARQDTALVEQRMQALLSEFQTAVSRIAQSFEQELVGQVGTENGSEEPQRQSFPVESPLV